jgi:hypothetical protein
MARDFMTPAVHYGDAFSDDGRTIERDLGRPVRNLRLAAGARA